MNTEQLKTAEQFLKESFERAKVKYPEENWKEFHEVQIEREFIGEAMNSFASQESNRAVDEFKEKLKAEILSMRNNRHTATANWTLQEAIDLIDKL